MLTLLYSYYKILGQYSSIVNGNDDPERPPIIVVQDQQFAHSYHGDQGQSEQFFARRTTYAACGIHKASISELME